MQARPVVAVPAVRALTKVMTDGTGSMRTALVIGTILAAWSAAASAKVPSGVWANPSNSVHVTFKRCGEAMCGTVVWASDKAQADARRGGTERLVGSRLFDGFEEEERGQWRGDVFVPDLGQSITGTIRQVDARTLTGESCLLGNFGCRTQTWRRVR